MIPMLTVDCDEKKRICKMMVWQDQKMTGKSTTKVVAPVGTMVIQA